jgi:hypothetical protein
MNKSLILNWLLRDAEAKADDHYDQLEDILPQGNNLKETLEELNNRREIPLPPSLPKTPDKMIPVLRKHFKDNVTFISAVLHHYFPKQYFFYRVSRLEKEIFEGLEFFKEVVPEFAGLRFPGVGRTGFGRYLKLNEALLNFARGRWPGHGTPQRRLMYFLYEGLGRLFMEKSDHSPYWIAVAGEDNFWDLDSGDDIPWSSRKEMKTGDLVFMYRKAPRKAITDIYRVKSEPYFTPWGGWGGFDAYITKVCAIEDIAFADMRTDDVLGKWGTVKKFFVGVVAEPVSPVIYNRLLKKVPGTLRKKHHLEFAEVVQSKSPQPPPGLTQLPAIAWDLSGQFPTEAKFEEEVIIPMLKRWGFKYTAQHTCPFRIGSQDYRGEVDFLVSDEVGPLTLFEDKLRIVNDKDLNLAVAQAKSYALLLGLPSCVVASPEGMWPYSLDRNKEKLERIPTAEVRDQEKELRNLLLKLRQQSTAPRTLLESRGLPGVQCSP